MSNGNNGLSAAILAIVGIPAAALGLFAVGVHFDTEEKIKKALKGVYGRHTLTIERVEGGLNSICFNVLVFSEQKSQWTRHSVMVNGDNDGGAWLFDREYPSMGSCTSHIDRG